MVVIDLLVDGAELAQLASVHHTLSVGVLVAHVGLEGDGLNASVGAQLALILTLSRMAHFVASQRVVVTSSIGANITPGKYQLGKEQFCFLEKCSQSYK